MKDYDVVIIGGGMVGASMACALSALPLRIAVVEAFPLKSGQQPSYDVRSIALAQGSKIIFDSMGLWPGMQPGATAITRIHISERGHFGTTRLDAREEGVEALGYVVENRFIGQALGKVMAARDNIELLCPAQIQGLHQHAEQVEIEIQEEGQAATIRAKLLIAADGGNSKVRELLHIDSHRFEYGQTAVIATVTPGKPHHHVAYERFTDSGPLALLPLSDNRMSLVYTVRDEQVDELMSLDDNAFLARLQERFGYRLGRFVRTSARKAFPLALMKIKQDTAPRVAFIGNAAHTVHPVAGQGFNLGIRDVAALAEVIGRHLQQGGDIGEAACLQEYSQWRKADQRQVALFTDGLARLFTLPLPPLSQLRSKGLAATHLIGTAKHTLARQAMGLRGRLPRLSRGLPL